MRSLKRMGENRKRAEHPRGWLRLLPADIRRGILRNILWFFPVIFLVTFSVSQRYTLWAADAHYYGDDTPPGLTDYVFWYFQGSYPVPEDSDRPPEIPVEWLCIQLYLVFLVGKYSLNDLNKGGKNALIRCPKRSVWWYERCLWSGLCALIYYGLTMAVMTASFLVLHGAAALRSCLLSAEDPLLFAACYAAPLMSMITLALLQHFLSLILRPIYGLILLAAWLMASVFKTSPLLIGNLSMLCRSRYYAGGGSITLGQVMGMCLALSCVSILAGGMYFKRKDIL